MPFSRSLRFLYTERLRLPLWGIFFLMLLFTCWITWFSSVKVPLYEVTDIARLEVDQASCPVQASVEGKIVDICVRLGQEIRAGTTLVKLDDHLLELKRKEIQDQNESLSSQLSALRKQISQEEILFKEKGKIVLIKLQEAKLQYQAKEAATNLAEEEVRRLGRLYELGSLPQIKLLQAESEAKEQKALAEALRISLGRLEEECHLQDKESQVRLSQLRQELLRIQAEMQRNASIVRQLECEIENCKIKAHACGRMAEVADLHIGKFIPKGYIAGYILPDGRLKAVAFFLPADAMGKIFPAQKAYLRLKGFPSLQYRRIAAKVEKVSQETRDSMIRIDLKLTPCNFPIPLQHGLPARVEIETERITPAVLVLRKAGKLLSSPPGGQ